MTKHSWKYMTHDDYHERIQSAIEAKLAEIRLKGKRLDDLIKEYQRLKGIVSDQDLQSGKDYNRIPFEDTERSIEISNQINNLALEYAMDHVPSDPRDLLMDNENINSSSDNSYS